MSKKGDTSKADTSATDTSGKRSVRLRKQKHGGALQVGNPGNKGGTGRPPSQIRSTARDNFDTLLPRIMKIAEAGDTRAQDVIKAAELMGKYGLGSAGKQMDLELVSDIAQAVWGWCEGSFAVSDDHKKGLEDVIRGVLVRRVQQ